jgi:hypothetical protein
MAAGRRTRCRRVIVTAGHRGHAAAFVATSWTPLWPDGAAVLLTSELRVFDADLRAHATRGPCQRAGRPPLPIPSSDSR